MNEQKPHTDTSAKIIQFQSNPYAKKILLMIPNMTESEVDTILAIDNRLGAGKLSECCFMLKWYIEEVKNNGPILSTRQSILEKLKRYDRAQLVMAQNDLSPEEYSRKYAVGIPATFLKLHRDDFELYLNTTNKDALQAELKGCSGATASLLVEKRTILAEFNLDQAFLRTLKIDSILFDNTILFETTQSLDQIYLHLDHLGDRIATKRFHQEALDDPRIKKRLTDDIKQAVGERIDKMNLYVPSINGNSPLPSIDELIDSAKMIIHGVSLGYTLVEIKTIAHNLLASLQKKYLIDSKLPEFQNKIWNALEEKIFNSTLIGGLFCEYIAEIEMRRYQRVNGKSPEGG